jgi:hypothetical protein
MLSRLAAGTTVGGEATGAYDDTSLIASVARTTGMPVPRHACGAHRAWWSK